MGHHSALPLPSQDACLSSPQVSRGEGHSLLGPDLRAWSTLLCSQPLSIRGPPICILGIPPLLTVSAHKHVQLSLTLRTKEQSCLWTMCPFPATTLALSSLHMSPNSQLDFCLHFLLPRVHLTTYWPVSLAIS